jgi:hypothetical protein
MSIVMLPGISLLFNPSADIQINDWLTLSPRLVAPAGDRRGPPKTLAPSPPRSSSLLRRRRREPPGKPARCRRRRP